MFRARKQLGKRQTADSANGFRPKKFRTDQQVPILDGADDGEVATGSSKDGEEGAPSVGRFGRRIVRGQMGDVLLDCEIPRYGTPVERKHCRKAGDYIIGHELGTSPGVPQTQYLARKEGTDEYYLLKILSFDPETEIVDKEVLQGKVLLHNEYTLLTMLDDLDGVIHQHGFFSDYAFEERQIDSADGTPQSIYTGRIRRRLMLVLDCVNAHEFCERSSAFISLQRYITVTKYTELEALQLFHGVVTVVEQLHARNIIHRDLKLNNIMLNRHTKRIVLTNFFLGKQLINERELLFDQRGSPAYISPDVLGGKPYKGKPSDIWALGVILYTIIYGKFPFLDTTPTGLFRKIREVDYVIPAGFKTSETTNMLIKSMLTLNPEDRSTASEVRVQLERMLRKMRPRKHNVDQRVPEMPLEDETAGQTSVDQSIPNVGHPAPACPSSAPRYEPMEVDVDPTAHTIAPGTQPGSPKYELSTEPFSRVLEANHRRQQLGADTGPPKKVTTTLRFIQAPADHQQQYPFAGGPVPARNGGQASLPNVAGPLQQANRTLPSVDAQLAATGADRGTGGQQDRFNFGNFSLNVQYSARSYNSAAEAVAAAVVAMRGTGAITSSAGVNVERNANVTESSNPVLPISDPNQSSRTFRTAPSMQPQPSAVNVLPSVLVGYTRVQVPRPPPPPPTPVPSQTAAAGQVAAPLPPAVQQLYAIMNHITHIRCRLPPTMRPPLGAEGTPRGEADVGAGLDFNGIITQEIADRIVPYLIVNLRQHDRVIELFRGTNGTGGAGDPGQRVNNLLELLRQLGVRMEARNGQIVIRAEQLRERCQFLGILLRIAGFNDKYFVPLPNQQLTTKRQTVGQHPLA